MWFWTLIVVFNAATGFGQSLPDSTLPAAVPDLEVLYYEPLNDAYLRAVRSRYRQMGREEDFMPLLHHLAKSAAWTPQAAIMLAQVYIQSGDWAGAQHAIDSARKQFPNDPRLFTVQARIYDGQGFFEKSLLACNKALHGFRVTKYPRTLLLLKFSLLLRLGRDLQAANYVVKEVPPSFQNAEFMADLLNGLKEKTSPLRAFQILHVILKESATSAPGTEFILGTLVDLCLSAGMPRKALETMTLHLSRLPLNRPSTWDAWFKRFDRLTALRNSPTKILFMLARTRLRSPCAFWTLATAYLHLQTMHPAPATELLSTFDRGDPATYSAGIQQSDFPMVLIHIAQLYYKALAPSRGRPWLADAIRLSTRSSTSLWPIIQPGPAGKTAQWQETFFHDILHQNPPDLLADSTKQLLYFHHLAAAKSLLKLNQTEGAINQFRNAERCARSDWERRETDIWLFKLGKRARPSALSSLRKKRLRKTRFISTFPGMRVSQEWASRRMQNTKTTDPTKRLKTATFRTQWQFRPPNPENRAERLSVSDSTIRLTLSSGAILCIDESTGLLKSWNEFLSKGGQQGRAFAASDPKLMVWCSSRFLSVIQASPSSRQLWQVPLSAFPRKVISFDHKILVLHQTPRLSVYREPDGRQLWTIPFAQSHASNCRVTVFENRLYLFSGGIRCYDLSTGSLLWEYSPDSNHILDEKLSAGRNPSWTQLRFNLFCRYFQHFLNQDSLSIQDLPEMALAQVYKTEEGLREYVPAGSRHLTVNSSMPLNIFFLSRGNLYSVK